MYSRGQNKVYVSSRKTEIKRPRVIGTAFQRAFQETIDVRLHDDGERLNDSTTRHIHTFILDFLLDPGFLESP